MRRSPVVRWASLRQPFESIVGMCARLHIAVLAEGVETAAERNYLRDLNVDLMQGFLFAPPAFQSLAVVEPQCFSA